jgi:predicted metalloprotease with PDZ domain
MGLWVYRGPWNRSSRLEQFLRRSATLENMLASRYSSIALLCLFAAFAQAEIVYTVKAAPGMEKITVEMTIPTEGKSEVMVQMPRWAPGSYSYRDNMARVGDMSVLGLNGAGEPRKVDGSTLALPTAGKDEITFSYTVPISNDNGSFHWSGPSTYFYVVDRKDEKCRLDIQVPDGWKVAAGLNPLLNPHSFTAPDYDVLADNPVTIGDFYEDRYTVKGKPHFIVVRGNYKDDVDRARLKKVCEQVTKDQAHFFGGLPYDRYVWHFVTMDQPNGGWGLEHLSSTQIGLATGIGYRTVGVISHEFFHLWHVKRTRSLPLGPFNYQELPQTGALWYLEGGTDYYAHLLLRRYGRSSDADFLGALSSNVQRTWSNDQRFQVSPFEASFRVRDASNGRGNSAGYGVNYYNTGFLASLCLDLELRARTNHQFSLDDVTRKLYHDTKDGKPGYQETAVRDELVKLGGLGMGYFYDQVILKPGELPLAEQLAKVGLRVYEKESVVPDLGFSHRGDRASGGLVVREPKGVAEGKLIAGDVILEVNGKKPNGTSNRWLTVFADEHLDTAKPGVELKLKVKREGQEAPVDVVIVPGSTTRKAWVVEEMEKPSREALEFRKKWLSVR